MKKTAVCGILCFTAIIAALITGNGKMAEIPQLAAPLQVQAVFGSDAGAAHMILQENEPMKADK